MVGKITVAQCEEIAKTLFLLGQFAGHIKQRCVLAVQHGSGCINGFALIDAGILDVQVGITHIDLALTACIPLSTQR